MTDKVITQIVIADDAIILGYYEAKDHPVVIEQTMIIPADFAQENDQLWQDFKELVDDAGVLLDSAEAAYHKRDVRMKEMGRT
jgi:hypothetical protein